jgi:hypothetical protein
MTCSLLGIRLTVRIGFSVVLPLEDSKSSFPRPPLDKWHFLFRLWNKPRYPEVGLRAVSACFHEFAWGLKRQVWLWFRVRPYTSLQITLQISHLKCQNVHQQQCIVDNDVQQIGSSAVSLMEQRGHPDRPLFTFCTVLFIMCLWNRYPCWWWCSKFISPTPLCLSHILRFKIALKNPLTLLNR